MGKKIIQKSGKYFTEGERHKIIQEFISTRCTKVEIWKKYTGEKVEHGHLLRWMRQLGYDTEIKTGRRNIASNLYPMTQKKTKPTVQKKTKPVAQKKTKPTVQKKTKPDNSSAEDAYFENLQLKKRVADLERQVKSAELKAIAFSTMVDIAEDMFNIPIRKKLNTKP